MVEPTGISGKEGLDLIKIIGSKIAEVTGEKKSTELLFQLLSSLHTL